MNDYRTAEAPQQRSIDDCQSLALDNIRLVQWCLTRMIARFPSLSKYDRDDLYCCGCVVLVKAANMWCDDGRSKFCTYAVRALEREFIGRVNMHGIFRHCPHERLPVTPPPRTLSLERIVFDDGDKWSEAFPSRECTQETVELNERIDRAHALVESLRQDNPRLAWIVEQVYFRGRSCRDIAAEAGCSRTWIDAQLKQAIKLMRVNKWKIDRR